MKGKDQIRIPTTYEENIKLRKALYRDAIQKLYESAAFASEEGWKPEKERFHPKCGKCAVLGKYCKKHQPKEEDTQIVARPANHRGRIASITTK